MKRILVLWTLLAFQLCLIGLFVGFGTDRNVDTDDAIVVDAIQFIVDERKQNISSADQILQHSTGSSLSLNINVFSISNQSAHPVAELKDFERDFVNCETTSSDNNETIPFYCYRHGSIEPSQIHIDLNGNDNDEQSDCVCKCQPNYHGRDCGQPEVVWRAFMTARLSRKNVGQSIIGRIIKMGRTKVSRPPRIFNIIEATAISLSTVEMQFMELNEIVDLFVLCDQITSDIRTSKDHLFSYHQSSYHHSNDMFLKKYKHKIMIIQSSLKCTPKLMYKHLTRLINAISKDSEAKLSQIAEDIVLFSRADEIVNRQAIAYLKWYSDWSESQPIRFRLKHTVYGFYWQHPNYTVLASFACQMHVLNEMYNGDPERVLQENSVGMTIGDLNHYGGWYCQYCYESPAHIVERLRSDKELMAINRVTYTANKRVKSDVSDNRIWKWHNGIADGDDGDNVDNSDNNHQKPTTIDANYIQTLISAGLFVDHKTNLLRLHRYSDKYYAPKYVCTENSKYQSMLTNMYAHYDTDILDEM